MLSLDLEVGRVGSAWPCSRLTTCTCPSGPRTASCRPSAASPSRSMPGRPSASSASRAPARACRRRRSSGSPAEPGSPAGRCSRAGTCSRSAEDELRKSAGAEIGMIFQDPLSSLHPYYKVGWQIVEMIRQHDHDMSKAQARARAVELLKLVGIPQPDRRVDDYPHQFSGGMRQRAMIAMAMSLNPKLLIADEPTTALDVTVQAQVLAGHQDLAGRVRHRGHPHHPRPGRHRRCGRRRAGDVRRGGHGKGRPATMFFANHHPYTEGLLLSLPAYGGERERLRPIHGQPPSLISLPPGCPFAPRCPYVMDRCRTETPPWPRWGTMRPTCRRAGCRTTWRRATSCGAKSWASHFRHRLKRKGTV